MAHDREYDCPRASVTVASCLGSSVLESAKVVAGQEWLETPVTWVSVIEWPIENFVSPGDFVLTTGMSCDADQLALFIEQAAGAGAAAVCLSVGRNSHHPEVPPVVIECARRHRVALIAIPWEVRFSDVSRLLIDMLYVERSHASQPGGEDLPSAFTRALLKTGGVEAIAHALEGVTTFPSLILDGSGAVAGQGSLAADRMNDQQRPPEILLGPLRLHIDNSVSTQPRRIDIGSESCIVASIVGHRSVLGWTVVIVPHDIDLVAVESVNEAVRHGATASAIELLRQEAADELGSRALGQFMWWASSAEAVSADELAARSALLGYPVNARLKVAFGIVDAPDVGVAAVNIAAELVRRLRMRLQLPASVVTQRESEILAFLDDRESDLAVLLDDPALSAFVDRVSWGVAAGVHSLGRLSDAVAQARTAVAVARATMGPGKLVRADELGPLMLLNALASDQVATKIAQEAIGPLERTDRERGSDLLGTLAIYLAENGNVSSAARRLHLNRHSLIYRLNRIKELTGRDLDSHEDRLLLDISMRLRRLNHESRILNS